MFRNMEYIYKVYKEKSFSKAAEKLYISQPSLSLTIKKTETQAGAKIFDRSTTPISLTDCGREYIRCAEQIMDIESGFNNYLSDINDLKTGSLSIGAGNFFASYILPPIIARFQARYPHININLVESDTFHLEKRLYAGELDLVADNYDFDKMVYKKHFFYSEQMVLAVPESLSGKQAAKKYSLTVDDILKGKHLELTVKGVPLELFRHTPFVMLRSGNDTHYRAKKILKEYQISPPVILELDQLATAYHVVCQGMGAAFISDTIVRETLRDSHTAYYKIDSSYAKRSNYLYYKKGKYLTRAIREFLTMLE